MLLFCFQSELRILLPEGKINPVFTEIHKNIESAVLAFKSDISDTFLPDRKYPE